jgi:hypothetical protein
MTASLNVYVEKYLRIYEICIISMDSMKESVINITDNEKVITEIDVDTGYVNATQLCKNANKLWHNYFKSQKAKRHIECVAKVLNIPEDDVMTSTKGGSSSYCYSFGFMV